MQQVPITHVKHPRPPHTEVEPHTDGVHTEVLPQIKAPHTEVEPHTTGEHKQVEAYPIPAYVHAPVVEATRIELLLPAIAGGRHIQVDAVCVGVHIQVK
jgi:hypothetical protein